MKWPKNGLYLGFFGERGSKGKEKRRKKREGKKREGKRKKDPGGPGTNPKPGLAPADPVTCWEPYALQVTLF